MKIILLSTLGLVAALALAGCTSVSSRMASTDPNKNNGIVYSLPNRMIDVQVDFSETGDHKITVKGGNYYSDGDDKSRYVARIHRGKIGKVAAKLTTSAGLLATADAKYTGQADEFAKALGSALGFVGAARDREDIKNDDPAHCKRNLTASHSIPLPDSAKFYNATAIESINALGGNAQCAQVSIVVTRVGTFSPYIYKESDNSHKTTRTDGLWYRVGLPYTVRAQIGDGAIATALIMFPDESHPFFVKMESGIFADAESKLIFTNGMLTTYEKNNDSEVISLLKLPAGVISAYAEAVGNIFSNFSTAEKHEINAQVAEINREIMLRKIETCNLAISQNQPADTIKELCNIQPLP